MITALKPTRILHVMVSITQTNGQFNQHCLPLMDTRDISLCTYFQSTLATPAALRVFQGDNTLRGFFRALKQALSQKPDVVHVHAPITGALYFFANMFRRRVMAKSVYTVRNSYMSYKLRNRLLMIPIFFGFGRIVMCSQSCHESLPWLLRWLSRGKTEVVSNSVDLSRIDRTLDAEIPQLTDQPFQVVSVGRFIPIKNHFTLLTAFHATADDESQLVLIGEGGLREEVVKAARRINRHGQVTTTGLIPREDVFRRVRGADLFVSTSLGEGLPVAVLEAMGCGLPVVLSDIPPHREIADGVDFIPLVDAGDADGFAREIERFQQMPGSERQALGAKCRRLVEERYGLDAMLNNYDEVYASVLEQGGGRVDTSEIAGQCYVH